jgi:hypothetical protein
VCGWPSYGTAHSKFEPACLAQQALHLQHHLKLAPVPAAGIRASFKLQSLATCAGARDVVFFMHGILDTAMGWVCNGVTGSNAFAAYDAGYDVWLGNSRANPPRLHMGGSGVVSGAVTSIDSTQAWSHPVCMVGTEKAFAWCSCMHGWS